jgi:hypothetical protein
MTQHACSPGIVRHPQPGAVPGDEPETLLELPPLRCSDAARMRGESVAASAVRHRRFLLIEVPGPWGRSALDGKHLDAGVARKLGEAASDADAHVLLIRRPGRHPAAAQGARQRAWALADVSPGAECVRWGTWSDCADLLTLELTAEIPADASETGPQRLALACTNGKRDQCCAIRGRPVADAIAGTNWDTWECSHLGGHRFAATVLLLPTGDMFGWLDPDSALEVVGRFDAGQLMLSHYRGRAGQSVPVQAALHAAAVRLGDFRRDAFAARSACPAPEASGAGRHEQPSPDDADLWEVEIIHRTEQGPAVDYRMTLVGFPLAPALLSCLDASPKAETRYEVLTFFPTR